MPPNPDELSREARAPLETFAAMVRDELAVSSSVAGPIVAGGILGADTFQPTFDALTEIDITGSATALAVGKAAGPMALAWMAAGGDDGHIVLARSSDLPPSLAPWEVHRAEHPHPGPGSLAAGRTALELVRKQDHVALLISGGASSLIEDPTIDEDDHAELHADLWRAGLPIDVLNAARGLISNVKAGGLARAAAEAECELTVLVASDVPGDDPGLVGSGPAMPIPDATLRERTRDLPPELRARVEAAARDPADDPPPPYHLVVAARERAAQAASGTAANEGYEPRILRPLDGPLDEGARRVTQAGADLAGDEALILWGEPLQRVPADAGRGGRTTHLLLAIARELQLEEGTASMAATDGQDGPGGVGGAFVRLDVGIDDRAARRALEAHASADLLAELPPGHGGVVPQHVTGANSADVGVIVREPSSN